MGFNLQAASIVINLDLPWNPAKLEQRIARAWRKHQTKKVQVINLVSEGTIEHRMLWVLDLKQRLSDCVLDLGDVETMEMPSGRKAFMEQLTKIIGTSQAMEPETETKIKAETEIAKETQTKEEEPLTLFQQEVLARFKARLHHLTVYPDETGKQTIFAVMDGDLTHPREQMHQVMKDVDPNATFQVEVLDRVSFEAIQRLCKAGILSFNQEKAKSLYYPQKPTLSHYEEQQKHLKMAQHYQEPMGRKERMASLLIEGEFYEEALAPLQEVFELSLKAFAALTGAPVNPKEAVPLALIKQDLVAKKGLPDVAIEMTNQIRQEATSKDKDQIIELFQKVQFLTQFLENKMNTFTLEKAA